MGIFMKHKRWFIAFFALAAVVFLGHANILQAADSDQDKAAAKDGERKVVTKDFVKCESGDDECFKQYEEELQDAQKDIARNQDVQETVSLSEAAKHKEVTNPDSGAREIINLNKSIKSMQGK